MTKHEVELLDSDHVRLEFKCKHSSLENYILKYVNQDIKRKLAVCYVIANEKKEVVGYYTLSTDSVQSISIPEELRKKLPVGYKNLPATLLGRLAVRNDAQGKGIGEMLLLDALSKAHDNSKIIASMAVVVDPIDEAAISFYHKYGFILLPDSGKMFIAMKTLDILFSKK